MLHLVDRCGSSSLHSNLDAVCARGNPELLLPLLRRDCHPAVAGTQIHKTQLPFPKLLLGQSHLLLVYCIRISFQWLESDRVVCECCGFFPDRNIGGNSCTVWSQVWPGALRSRWPWKARLFIKKILQRKCWSLLRETQAGSSQRDFHVSKESPRHSKWNQQSFEWRLIDKVWAGTQLRRGLPLARRQ